MRETWYVLEDGSFADPADVVTDKKGALRHKNGVAVAMRGQVPSTRGVDPDEERAKAVRSGTKSINEARADTGKSPIETKDLKAEEPKYTYRTRDSKAD